MIKNRNPLKQPNRHFSPPPCHWTKTERGHWKVKTAYSSEEEAEEWLKLHPKLMKQGMKSYQCSICNKWHCGHNKITI
nr:MAG TPA: Kruppel-like factor 3 finger, kruppel-like, DNA BINDING [Caudoviricetes sp.]